ncbi:hypothetical protein [Streptomyces sp. NPDC007904]|jgi:hypothetical protein|uniref:hypothetical protein n=1 Tax=Streptomyces sp. NPDC007904 TaxID=3364787 RepID=UPI0036DFCCAE
MTDTTRRPGDALPPEGTRTTAPGASGTPGPHGTPGASGPHGDAHDTGRETAPPGAQADSPLVAAHPQAGGAPGGGTARHGATRTPGPDDTPGTVAGRGTAPGADAHRDGSGTGLLPHDDGDKLAARLHHAVAGFVDAPRDAVEEADQVLQELTARFTEAVTERRRTLRRSWQAEGADGGAAATDTEQLRLALRDYRELAERLLRV